MKKNEISPKLKFFYFTLRIGRVGRTRKIERARKFRRYRIMPQLKKCTKCKSYTLKENCPKDKIQTVDAHYKFKKIRDAPKDFKR